MGVLAALEALAMFGALVLAGERLVSRWLQARDDDRTIPGLRLAGVEAGDLEGPALRAVAAAAALTALDRPLTVRAGRVELQTTPRGLGAVPDLEATLAAARDVGRSGDLLEDLRARIAAARGDIDLPLGHRFDEARALDALLSLAPEVDTPSLPTRLDLQGRKVLPATRGTALLAHDSLSTVAIGLASGAEVIDLVVQHKPEVEDPLRDIADELDIGIVLGSFDTPYSTAPDQRDRTHNLELGAAAIDGKVLMPGETFSFNETVGDRSVENGYRYATGIAAGELIDSVGGGICQVSSTIFGAAFFGGLEIVSARPHSRPSNYVDMGLDSTVVFPSVDLVFRNPYDFPVVLHMTVSQGKVRAEVLGARRPYQVAFERELKEVVPFKTVWRDDPRLRTGTEVVAQQGMRGFKLERRRKLYQAGEVVATESWELYYPPTAEIVRRGTDPNGEIPQTTPKATLRDPAPQLRLVQ